jgi:predicted O-methyltransferase YrrM
MHESNTPEHERQLILSAAAAHMGKARTILEIGTFRFGTTALLALTRPDLLISVDLHQPDMDHHRRAVSDFASQEGFAYHHIVGSSRDMPSVDSVSTILDAYASGVDLLFIDGDHTVGGCTSDWNHYSPMVRSGGMVAIHDSVSADVRGVVSDIESAGRFRVVWADTRAPGLAFVYM